MGISKEEIYSDGGPIIEAAKSLPLTFKTFVSLAG
jgi:hypothetical protein